MPDLKNLTRTYWKNYQKRSNLESKKLFSFASVGSAIDKLNSRRASWQRSRTDMNLLGYYRALENLKKQMNRFVAAKEFKTAVAAQFFNEIVKWKQEIETKLTKLARKLDAEGPALAKANAKELTPGRVRIFEVNTGKLVAELD